MLPGVLRYENTLEVGVECVLITTKGEAIALAIAQMATSTIATCDHGIVAKTKRVILDRDVYDKKWKLGPYSKKKDELKQAGQLDKYGRVSDKTPEAWKMLFGDPDKAVALSDVKDAIKPQQGTEQPKEEISEKKRDKKKKDKKDKKKDKKKKKETDSDSD